MRGQIGFAAHIDGMQSGHESTAAGGTLCPQVIGSGGLKSLDGLGRIVVAERELGAEPRARDPNLRLRTVSPEIYRGCDDDHICGRETRPPQFATMVYAAGTSIPVYCHPHRILLACSAWPGHRLHASLGTPPNGTGCGRVASQSSSSCRTIRRQQLADNPPSEIGTRMAKVYGFVPRLHPNRLRRQPEA